jgi:Actinobacteria/chloroflexi VLRF1 release factor
MKNPAAGGGRWVEVPPERLVSWIATFGGRHHGISLVAGDAAGESVTFTAADGSSAECHPPFPPMRTAGGSGGAGVEEAGRAITEGAAEAMVAHAVANRIVGVLLVRLGGYAAGVFSGSPPQLVRSKTGSRLVHGRSAAGGWSQHRFARRRENQAATALHAAADAAAGVFGPYGPDGLDAVVLGGDKRSAAGLRDDARLVPYLDRAVDRFITVPDPRLAVLRDIPRDFLAIRIRLTEPEPDGPAHIHQVN